VIDTEKSFTLHLAGRYYAVLSVLPYIFLIFVVFFLASLVLVSLWVQNVFDILEILMLPTILGSAMLLPFLGVFLFMIRWHGKRRLDLDNTGVTMVLPNEKKVFIPWEFLGAVELRFARPNTVQCTLVSPAIRFTFTNLELNLEQRLPLRNVFTDGFDVVKLREFLYYLHRKAPHLSWRMGESFKDKFKIHYPPYDLEKLK
jgi:hypothetical protein